MIIGITGRKGHGKNAVASAIHAADPCFRQAAFADVLKDCARMLFDLTEEQVNGSLTLKEAIDPRWGVSPRFILQQLGTNVARSIHPDVWVRALARRIDEVPKGDWLITDVRFENEATMLRERGGFIVKVVRLSMLAPEGTAEHLSESSVDTVKYDGLIHNTGTLEELAERARKLYRHFQLEAK